MSYVSRLVGLVLEPTAEFLRFTLYVLTGNQPRTPRWNRAAPRVPTERAPARYVLYACACACACAYASRTCVRRVHPHHDMCTDERVH